jgi:predicted nucleotidyltransferase
MSSLRPGHTTQAVGASTPGTRPLRDLVEAHRDQIKAIATRHQGISIALFGSVARGQERPGSDLDFLVELAPGARPFEILAIGAELEDALGVKVDVGTPESLRPRNPN